MTMTMTMMRGILMMMRMMRPLKVPQNARALKEGKNQVPYSFHMIFSRLFVGISHNCPSFWEAKRGMRCARRGPCGIACLFANTDMTCRVIVCSTANPSHWVSGATNSAYLHLTN